MKRRILAGLASFAALSGLLLAAPFLLPANLYKSRIEQSITDATGRAFKISGPLRLSLFPGVAIRADKISLANLPGRPVPFIVTADDIGFGIRLWPLLSGRLEVTQIVLDHPIITLEVDAQGHANWLLRHAQNANRQGQSPHTTIVERFSGVKIERGRVTYANLRSGGRHTLDNIDATIDVTNLDQPTTADGVFTFAEHRVAFRITAATPRLLLEEHTAAIDVSTTSDLMNAAFKGTIAADGVLNGAAKIDTRSAHAAGAWLGAHLPQTGGLGPLSLESHIQGDNRHIRLTAMTLRLNEMTAKGDIAIDTELPVPHVVGGLTIDHLDVNPYIEHPRKPGTPHPHRDNESWSDEPFTLDTLKKTDADLTLDVGGITLRNLELGKAHIIVALHDAQIRARLERISLYGGTGRATLAVDARNTPAFHNILEFDNVALQPFLSSTIGVKQIEGAGTIRLDATSTGNNADAIMHRLSGNGSIDFHDGQLRGVDLGTVARSIQSLLGSAIRPEAFTKYATMRSSFVLANGLLTANDFRLEGPVLHMTGAGAVDIGNRAIDFKIVPQASAVIAKQKLSLGLPFRIKGPWKHVRYTADFTGLVNSVLDNLNSGRAPFKRLFGNEQPKDPNAPKKKHKNIGDALKNMFGIH